jgi:hypothetical protein
MLNLKLLSDLFSRSKTAASERRAQLTGLEETVLSELEPLGQSDVSHGPAEPYQATIPMGLIKR